MSCLSPIIDKTFDLIPPFDLRTSFIMDNLKITLDNDFLSVVDDPIYHPFANSVEEINATNTIRFTVNI